MITNCYPLWVSAKIQFSNDVKCYKKLLSATPFNHKGFTTMDSLTDSVTCFKMYYHVIKFSLD